MSKPVLVFPWGGGKGGFALSKEVLLSSVLYSYGTAFLYSYRNSDETNVAFLAAVRGGNILTWLYMA
jgi:hypothetical protein